VCSDRPRGVMRRSKALISATTRSRRLSMSLCTARFLICTARSSSGRAALTIGLSLASGGSTSGLAGGGAVGGGAGISGVGVAGSAGWRPPGLGRMMVRSVSAGSANGSSMVIDRYPRSGQRVGRRSDPATLLLIVGREREPQLVELDHDRVLLLRGH